MQVGWESKRVEDNRKYGCALGLHAKVLRAHSFSECLKAIGAVVQEVNVNGVFRHRTSTTPDLGLHEDDTGEVVGTCRLIDRFGEFVAWTVQAPSFGCGPQEQNGRTLNKPSIMKHALLSQSIAGRPTLIALAIGFIVVHCMAAEPVLPFSAKLANQHGIPLDGHYAITFRIYTEPTGGDPVWTEVHGAAHIDKGVLSVNLGSVSSFGGLELLEGYWLGVSVNDDVEMTPRVQVPAQAIVPAGTIAPFGGPAEKVPQGWMLCDGLELSTARYPRLYKAIGKAWGSSGSDKFRVPDLQGLFLRGVDGSGERDPDKASRIPIAPGANEKAAVGSYQPDGLKSHNHYLKYFRDYPARGGNAVFAVTPGYQGHPGSDYTEATGGSETRPKNAYVNYIIKY